MIAIDPNKQEVLDGDTKARLQINFTRNIESAGNATILCIIEESKETVKFA